MTIDFLRQYCTSLRGVTEDIKWDNDLCFCIGEKMFCVTSLEPPFRTSFKVTDEEFEDLTSQPGIMPAPYMARNKWIMVTDAARLRKADWQRYIRQSYELVAAKLTKKVRKDLGLD